ncbi:hypothetical protein OOK36_55320 [Streptomyces sp. NBC_00365]|uniref:hypothetical protein n=1 Tax=Streptomyces sp. NBC_00365 TaxID=2975726 RepID=UPI0022584455|nr:hypothetical protein [Streptomyces sp. NBC_00365]MCX5097626.1 hypothetical protein [Streptomyces sp. NBC_00365]
MRVRSTELPEEYGYFAWAVENLPATARYLQGAGTKDIEPHGLELAVRRAFLRETVGGAGSGRPVDQQRPGQYWSRGGALARPPGPTGMEISYAGLLRAPPHDVLGDPRAHYGADTEPRGPAADAAAYRLMLGGFLMAYLHVESCLPWLGVLLLRGPLDRQFTIGRFLRLMTLAEVGEGPDDRPPGRETVFAWAGAIHGGDVAFRPELSLELAVSAYRRALSRA